jgi:hypothetical protein
MRQRLFIFATVALVVLLLVALNAATYVKIEREPDLEWNPNRSTYNAGGTGTRALYDYLSETGSQVLRWRESPKALAAAGGVKPATFVVIGDLKEPFREDERKALLDWVKSGGRLVVIDRSPSWNLLPATGNTQVSAVLNNLPSQEVRPDNPADMTVNVALAKPVQPTLLTRHVESVQPSRFASHIRLIPATAPTPTPTPETSIFDDPETTESEEPPPPKPAPASGEGFGPPPEPVSSPPNAPVLHLAQEKEGPLVADYGYGWGRIVFLSDPFIVANSGLRQADNLQLALNIVAGNGGLIAFDEFHQGHSKDRNELIAYFSGTPVLALLAQGGLGVLLFIWARGRRFARPLPLAQVDRRSKLEFISSMAELQQRARAYDLALENIYTRTRRALARYAGVGHDSPRAAIARGVAAHSQLDAGALESLMRQCEDHINGEPLNAKQALELTARLRDTETALGLQSRRRESKQ